MVSQIDQHLGKLLVRCHQRVMSQAAVIAATIVVQRLPVGAHRRDLQNQATIAAARLGVSLRLG